MHGAKKINTKSHRCSRNLSDFVWTTQNLTSVCSAREVTHPTARSIYWLGQQSGTFLRTKDEDAQLKQTAFLKVHFYL